MTSRFGSCSLVAVLMLLILDGCGGGSKPPDSTPVPTPVIHNQWMWVSGANTANAKGMYGTQGTPASGNIPGARSYAVTWTDQSGSHWLFGGYGFDSVGIDEGDLNDLWKYSGGKWTWIGGSNLKEHPGAYGTQGVAADDNIPGARYQAVGWTDPSGNLWLFGGLGIDSNGTRGHLNDLWKYSGGKWTWVSGSNTVGEYRPGVYGIKGIPASTNVPGARVDASSWVDKAGNLWLFGGEGFDSTGALGILNDLWKYGDGEWTWMSGSDAINQLGVYGTLSTPAPGNVPGARTNAVTWVDLSGNLWLFGGEGQDSDGIRCQETLICELNDMWKYSAGHWAWMGGSSRAGQQGTYGTQGSPALGNIPGARWGAVAWSDSNGNFWLFGGHGLALTTSGDLNDLWKYSDGQWTWMSGANAANQTGAYGTGGADSISMPGARDSAVGWIDSFGNLWLFGGQNFVTGANGGKQNDLWEFRP